MLARSIHVRQTSGMRLSMILTSQSVCAASGTLAVGRPFLRITSSLLVLASNCSGLCPWPAVERACFLSFCDKSDRGESFGRSLRFLLDRLQFQGASRLLLHGPRLWCKVSRCSLERGSGLLLGGLHGATWVSNSVVFHFDVSESFLLVLFLAWKQESRLQG